MVTKKTLPATELTAAVKLALGYKFKKPELLLQALTHSSAKTEVDHTVSETLFLLWSKDKIIPATDNERLEFLGDAALGLIISDIIFREFGSMPEGGLTVMKSSMVNRTMLAAKAHGIGLEKLIIVGKGFSGRKLPESVLANGMEAMFGAIYLDQGMEALYKLISKMFKPEIDALKANPVGNETNFKALLQDYSQHNMNCLPYYRVVRESGPKHEPTFEVVVMLNQKPHGHGIGRSKKDAEQSAAQATLKQLGAIRNN
ncbi:MAG: ribonuclease III [Candidatus Brocadiia bacterium]